MIKWDGFGKLLKLSFFGLLISCFTLSVGSSVKAEGKYQPVGLNALYSQYDPNFNLTFLPKGGLITEVLGTSKGLLALKPTVMFWWHSLNGRPYVYVYATGSAKKSYQGFFDMYSVCSEITYDGDSYSGGNKNCTDLDFPEDYATTFTNFFNTVKNTDYSYYEYYDIDSASRYWHRFVVCWSSHELGRSLCFRKQYTNQEASYGSLTGLGMFYWSGMSFSSISSDVIGPAPGQVGYGGSYGGELQGSTTGNYNNTITGDYTYSTCTNGQILSYAESVGFSRYLCYGGLNNFDLYDSSVNYNAIPGSGKSLGQILSYSSAWDSPQDWFNFWNGLYGDSKYNDMWSSYPAVYHTWFDFYHQYGGEDFDFDTIRELCIMYDLDLDMNGTYNGTKFSQTCQFISQGGWDNYGGSGQYPQGVNWNGFGNSNNNSPSDGISFIQNFFNLTKSNVATDYSGGAIGFLPKYIIVFLLAIILFKFLKH